MTQIVLDGKRGSARITLEESAELKLVGAVLSAGGPLLASYQDGAWYLGTARFERITCEGWIRVEFQWKGGSRSFGPFRELSIGNDGVLTADGLRAQYNAIEEVWAFDRQEAQSIVLRGRGGLK